MMDTVFTFTPAQLIAGILAVAAGIVGIAKAVEVLSGVAHKAKAPQDALSKRIDECDKRLNDHDSAFRRYDEYFRRDKARLDALEEGNRVVQKALLALLAHAIDGNNTEQLVAAKDGLQQYLIER